MHIALAALIALKLALLFLLAVHGRFVMDEFVTLGSAKYLGHGFFTTIWPVKAVGYAVFFKLAHVIGWDARSILIAGRIEMAILTCGTVALVYVTAHALGRDRLRALVTVLVLLCFSNFLERSYRTIAEPVATFFAVAALCVVVRGRADRPARILMAGLLSGLSFLATQKAIYFNVALGMALVVDSAITRRYADGIQRGVWLVLGWAVPIMAYCVIFRADDPLRIAENLIFGPTIIAMRGGGDYGGLRDYVWQTLIRNAVLYLFCFGGMILELRRLTRLDERHRIALVFSLIIALLVFTHDQPWPYVFVMALPFVALWALVPFNTFEANRLHLNAAWAVLCVSIAASFAANVLYLRKDNHTQLALVARAESLLGPNEVYFDGIGMLPNRPEPSTLWLDRHFVLRTLREGKNSEVYRILADSPPKLILWSYRMDAVEPVVGPLLRNSYVQIAPNIRIAGVGLRQGQATQFNVPLRGSYALYDVAGKPLNAPFDVNGAAARAPLSLGRGGISVTLRSGAAEALLLPEGSYEGRFASGPDDPDLFSGVYD